MGLEIPRLRKLLHSRLVTNVVKSSGPGKASRDEWNGVPTSYHVADKNRRFVVIACEKQ